MVLLLVIVLLSVVLVVVDQGVFVCDVLCVCDECKWRYGGVPVAQWIARRTSIPEVAGSSPARDGRF